MSKENQWTGQGLTEHAAHRACVMVVAGSMVGNRSLEHNALGALFNNKL